MLARSLSLLFALILSGCAVGSFPKFPEKIKDHYVFDIRSPQLPNGLFFSALQYRPGEKAFYDTVINVKDIPQMAANEEYRCLKFEVVTRIPYTIKFISQVETVECNLVGGYKPEDSVSLYNWFEDVYDWAQKRKHCFAK